MTNQRPVDRCDQIEVDNTHTVNHSRQMGHLSVSPISSSAAGLRAGGRGLGLGVVVAVVAVGIGAGAEADAGAAGGICSGVGIAAAGPADAAALLLLLLLVSSVVVVVDSAGAGAALSSSVVAALVGWASSMVLDSSLASSDLDGSGRLAGCSRAVCACVGPSGQTARQQQRAEREEGARRLWTED